jgi:hypothetical protein
MSLNTHSNLLDRRLERLAYELFTAQGHRPDLVQFKIKELQMRVMRGYNTRAELISLVKKAQVLLCQN